MISLHVIAGAGLQTAMAQDRPAATAEPTGQAFWAKRMTGYLPARDGTLLRYSVLLPNGPGPFPTIVNYSGYDAGAIGGAAYLDGDTAMSISLDKTLVEHGYAVFGVNARGTGCSEGLGRFLGIEYGRDGADAIEFIATQSWSDGAVGMANWSWAGMSQIATASNRPRHLRAIAPGMVLGDVRLDSWFPGGVPAPAFVAGWWQFLHSRWDAVRRSAEAESDDRCLGQLRRNLSTSEVNSPPTTIIQHPLRDSFIEERHLSARTGNIQVPVLSMESFQDEAVTSREDYYQETLKPEWIWWVQTNGGHDLYQSLRFRTILLSFFDHFVRGKDNGFEASDHLQVWMEGSAIGNESEASENLKPNFVISFPSVTPKIRALTLALGPKNSLTTVRPEPSEPDTYQYPVRGPSINSRETGDSWGEMPADWRKGSVAFTSAPLEQTVLAYGPASANLWISSTATDVDLQVTLTELRPDGQEVFVQRGWLRMSDRLQDDGKSTELRPYPLDRPETMISLTPNEPALGRVELNKFGYPFRQGSRIRIWIDAPSEFGSYGFAPVSTPAVNTIWHDAQHPSSLVIGVLDGQQVPASRPACNSVAKQPCRLDPLAKLTHRQR